MDFQKQIKEIEISSPYYPQSWRELPNPPERIYAVGDISLLQTKTLVAVGSRRTPAPMVKLTQATVKELSYAVTLATGTAEGGDTAVIEGALLGSGKIICVLAGGLSALPQANLPLLERVMKRGLLLSPYPYETGVRVFSYEQRNMLLAALGEGVLVVSAGAKSGTLITAKHAKAQGKPVFAFPYPPASFAGAGCNGLIKSGGTLVENANDVCETLGLAINKDKTRNLQLSSDEEKLLTLLRELGESHINTLSARSGVPVFKARAVLSSLEVKGLVASLGGNSYSHV